MFIAGTVIYIILAILLGPLWPLQMFGRGGLIEKLIVLGWLSLMICGKACG